MKRVGLLLVSVAFLAVSVILVLDEREVSWLPYGLVLFFGAIGIVCIRLGDRAQAQREDLQTADVETLRSSLARVVEEATRLEAEKSEIGVYDLRVRIDERFRSDLEVFVDAREVLTHVYGLQAYAEVMSLFAAGERSDRETIGHGRSKGAEDGAHAEYFLGTAARDTKSRRDLVDDQDDLEPVAERANIAEILRICGRRRTVDRDRLDQEGGDLIAVAA